MNRKLKISVLFLKEGDSWVGQCLEHDIAAQGKTIQQAKTAFCHTVAGQMFLDYTHKKPLLAEIQPAPHAYREKFDKAEKLDYRFNFHLEFSDDVTIPEISEDVRVVLA